jgi:integrase
MFSERNTMNIHTRTRISKNIKYEEWLRIWLAKKEGFVKESTLAAYKNTILNHILPQLGSFPVAYIKEENIRHAVRHWQTSGALRGQSGLSQKSIKDILVIISISLGDALAILDIKKSPIPHRLLATAPAFDAGPMPEIKILNTEDYKRLVDIIVNDTEPKSKGILLALHTGIRIGELCALKWSDIDMTHKLLTVTKTIQRLYIKEFDGSSKSKTIITLPKTKTSNREIPLTDLLVNQFENIHGESFEDDYILTGTSHHIEPRNYRYYFGRYLERAGVNKVNFHALRHTFATEMIKRGADIKTLSVLLGHANTKITLDLYVHPSIEQKRKCIELLNS